MHRLAKLILLAMTLVVLPAQTCLAANDTLWKKLLDDGMNAIRAKNWKQADEVLGKSLVEAEKFGPQDSRVAASLVNIAIVRCNSKNFPEAISMSKRALVIDEKCYGKSTAVAYDYHQLGTYMDIAGQHKEATPYLKKALEMRKAISGVEPELIAITLGNLGENYEVLNQDADAVAAYKEGMQLLKDKQIPPQYFQFFDRLRDFYVKKNQVDKAYGLYDLEVADLGRRFGSDSPWVNLMLSREAAFLMSRKEYKRVEPVFRQLQKLAPKSPAGGKVAEAAATNGLAVCLFKQEKYSEAHDNFKRSLALIGANGDPAQVASVKLNMADCLEKLGKKKEAAEMRKGIPPSKK